jgi:hypothetical protein
MSVEDKLKELQALAEELNAKDAVEVIEEAKEEDEPKDSNSSKTLTQKKKRRTQRRLQSPTATKK